jgi:hypothetical protein
MLSYRFERIRLFKFPENLYERFKQIVLFGIRKRIPSQDHRICNFLRDVGASDVNIPFLPEKPDLFYEVPPSPSPKPFVFRSSEIDPQELEEELNHHGLNDEIRKLTTPLTMAERITSIMPLRHGHLAQLIACGFINGVVFDKDRTNPLVVRGATKKVVDRRVENEGDLERHIETDRIVITIKAFTRDGQLVTVQ